MTATPSRDRRSAARIRRLERGRPPSLEAVERRRWQLWIVAGIMLVAISGAVVLAFAQAGVTDLVPDNPVLRWSFLGLSVAFLLYVADQERALRRLTRALVDQEVLTASLEARISDLTELSKVGRVVNSVLTMDEVVEVVLSSAFELTAAHNGSVMMCDDDDDLRVAVSAGPEAAAPGTVVPADETVAALVLRTREPLLIDGTLEHGQLPGVVPRSTRARGSAVIAPLVVAERALGVLALERGPAAEPFSDLDLRSVTLFAQHAATAVANAQRFEQERHASARLADVIELRSEFVATLVHDLKSPLTAIIGFANMLHRRWDRLDPERRVWTIEAIEEQSQRLLSMVEEVLRSSSVEAGAELKREPIDLRDVLLDLRDSVRAVAEGKEGSVRAVTLVGADTPVTVFGDADALRHVFSNLLENAVKYSQPSTPITIDVERSPSEVAVHIHDEGEGIPEQDLAFVFERFRRSAQGSAGVGLGLYIVRTLVAAHGGHVSVESELGSGSTFTVRLPVRAESDSTLDVRDQVRSAVPPGR